MTNNPYDVLRELIAIGSPAGYTDAASDQVARWLAAYGYAPQRTTKGAVRCALGPAPRLAIAAHVDTLGAVVSNFNADGTLAISPVGGLQLNYVEGEYVQIVTLDERRYTGTYLLDNPSVHANNTTNETRRTANAMHVRLDESVTSPVETQLLGIDRGDVVLFDPRYQELPSGYIKSRFLDDKAGCYVLLEIARRLAGEGRRPPVELVFTVHEEVGHGGACGFADTIRELLVVDMGVVGNGCGGDERACSICAKDSSGPYHRGFRQRLVALARAGDIAHRQDVYPFYASDGSVALRAGHDLEVALIGPGVAASHGVERTHRRGVEATIALALAYIGTL